VTLKAGKAVDKDRLRQVRRALELERLGIEHIAAYRRISELGACGVAFVVRDFLCMRPRTARSDSDAGNRTE
jgi:hypothetical protein